MKRYKSDLLIVGGGVAGLFAAVTAREMGLEVCLADKAYAGKSGASIMASGQLNVFNPAWGKKYEEVFARIVEIGENLVNQDWLEVMLRESWSVYENLRDWGAEFPCPEEEFPTYMKAVHEFAEEEKKEGIEEPPLDMVPLKHRELPPKLRKKAESVGVRFADRVMVTDLIRRDGRIVGAVGFQVEDAEPVVFEAAATILSAGKNGFRAPGMNIAELTGDPDAMAYRAGADISGKEFPDMHINIARYLVWKGNGELYPAYWNFVDGEGEHIPMMGFDLSMASVIHAGRGPVVWDFASATEADIRKMKNYIEKRGAPFETERVKLGCFTGKNERIIGGSAAGSMAEQTAGIWPVDLYCKSTVDGLYAAGDCCSTWAWGAINAGAPPGLMPAGVTGRRAAKGAARYIGEVKGQDLSPGREQVEEMLDGMLVPLRRKTGFDPRWVCQLLQNTMMPYYILHIKRGDRLSAALVTVEFLRDHMVPRLMARDAHELRLCHEVRNMVLNAEMILRASLARQESRGWHYREDFPAQDDANWLAWVRMRRGEKGMEVVREPVPEKWRPKGPVEYRKKWLAWEQREEGRLWR
ncbi:MAG: FAD-dependent oxidoreductase [Oscillospiraceae bacterium]|jgi:succinate dehydrogenase/fumarate reductase flavoprotein subunit